MRRRHRSCFHRLQARLRDVRRDMAVCMVTRHRKVPSQKRQLAAIGIADSDIIMNMDRSALLKPLFIIVQDRVRQSLLLVIRGTTSLRDIFTSLSGTIKPHHVFGRDGVVLGYSHFGMLAAARWIYRQAKPVLEEFLAEHPGWKLRLVGHSLGGGTAALLCMMCALRLGLDLALVQLCVLRPYRSVTVARACAAALAVQRCMKQ